MGNFPSTNNVESTMELTTAPASAEASNGPNPADPTGLIDENTSPNVAENSSPAKEEHETSCGICLNELGSTGSHGYIASIDCCNHQFCLTCIKRWSKRENTCPFDKKRFSVIKPVNNNNNGNGYDTENCVQVDTRNQGSNDMRGSNGSPPIVTIRLSSGSSGDEFFQLQGTGLSVTVQRLSAEEFAEQMSRLERMISLSRPAADADQHRDQDEDMEQAPSEE